MKKTIIITFLTLVASVGFGQTHKHGYYGTVKTVKERVDYSPDTIPVYFKEVVLWNVGTLKRPGKPDSVLSTGDPHEIWRKGFVVWQTYKKGILSAMSFTSSGSVTGTYYSEPEYYTDPYQPTKSIPGIFLYEDKTKCKDLVVYSIKR